MPATQNVCTARFDESVARAGPAGLMAAGPESATDPENAERLSEDLIAMMDRKTVGQIRVEAGGRGGKDNR